MKAKLKLLAYLTCLFVTNTATISCILISSYIIYILYGWQGGGG